MSLVAPSALQVDALWAVLLAAWSAFAVLVALSGGYAGRRLLAVALFLVALDLWRANARTNLVPDAPGELTVTPVVAMLRLTGAQRVENEDRLPRNFGVMHRLESTYGASPLRLRTFDTLYDGLAGNLALRRALLGASHVVTWRSALDEPADVVLRDGSGEAATNLHALPNPWPYVWRAVSAEAATDDAAALARLADAGFNPMATVLVHDADPAAALDAAAAGAAANGPGDAAAPVGTAGTIVDADPAGAGGGTSGADASAGTTAGARGAASPADTTAGTSVGSVERAPGTVTASTSGPEPGWLVFSEMFYPGWRATVDGRSTPVVRADVALLAVPVAAGAQEVKLELHAPAVSLGLAISIMTALVLAAWVIGRLRRGQRSGGPS
jgi:hypothetical protein